MHYVAAVRSWNPRLNLVARSDIGRLVDRHVRDSLQVVELASPYTTGTWADIGSGGGFPGMVAAICRRHLDQATVLVDSDRRKCSFLRHVARTLSVTTSIFCERIEALEPQNAPIVTARALAPLDRLLGLVERHISPDGIALLPKGGKHPEELAAARKLWHFDCELVASITDPNAAILLVRNIARADRPS